MLPLFNAVCVRASVMCCIQECVTSINCGMCLGSFSPWSVTDYYLIQWLEFAVDGKQRAASLLTLPKLKFCTYRKIKWVCKCWRPEAYIQRALTHPGAMEVTLELQIQQGAEKLQDDWTFPCVPSWFYISAWQTLSSAQSGSLLLSILR